MIGAIIQARMNSTRLPGKVMKEFSGDSLLGHIVLRLSHSKNISRIIIATTINPSDDRIWKWCQERGVECFRGSEADVLNRYYEAAKHFGIIHIARITSDDPFKDPKVIDQVADLYLKESLDFAYNNKPPSFAEGLDTEIFSFKALTQANKNATDPFEREHVTQHFYRNPTLFKQKNLLSPVDFSRLRWTIDTEADFNMAKTVYAELYVPGEVFYATDILRLLEKHPEIAQINQDVKRSDMYSKKN